MEPPVVEPSAPDVVLTSYAILRNDAELLAIPGFGGMILDEAQHIKNFNTKLSKAVKDVAEVVGHLRVALSGTPVENSLTDLHSIFESCLCCSAVFFLCLSVSEYQYLKADTF